MIDAALELFCSAGYEKTMIIDITKKVGVANGTFYYYFPSKEAMLHTIISRHITQLITNFKNEICQLPSLHKLQLFINIFFIPTEIGVIIEKLKKENQYELINGLWHQTQTLFNPLLKEIFIQGNQEKTMHVVYPDETIPFFWSNVTCLLSSSHAKEAPPVFTKKTNIATSVLERVLGIKEGLLDLSIIQQ